MKNEPSSALHGGFYVTIATAAGSTTKKVEGDLLTVGRADDCHLTVSHETLSRRHLTITMKDGACWIEDHASSNGTFVNGKRINAHSLTRVLPEDQVTMGQAGVRLSVSAEPLMRKEGTPPIPNEKDSTHPNHTIVTSTQTVRQTARAAIPEAKPKPKEEAQDQAERLLQDSQRKAASLVQEAELEAERRVEDIYRRAHETQAKMDEVYQKRMNEAYRSAEQIYQKSQEEAQKILDAGRARSTEVREQAENFVMELRRRTEADCERLLADAQQTARDLKEQRMLEADDIISKKEEEVVSATRQVMNERMAKFENDLEAEAKQMRDKVQDELASIRLQFELDTKAEGDALVELRSEVKELRDLRGREQTLLAEVDHSLKEQKLKLDEANQTLAELKKTSEEVAIELDLVKGEIGKLQNERSNLDGEVKQSREMLAQLNNDVRTAELRVVEARDRTESQLIQVRARSEEDKAKVEKNEQAHFEELKLQTSRKIRELETQLVDELETKKEILTRELSLMVEAHVKEHKDGQRNIQDVIGTHLKKQIATIAMDDTAKAKQASLISLKRRQKYKAIATGLMVGIFGTWGGERMLWKLRSDLSPMQRRVVAAQDERKADLELRKFNPPQTHDYKETYVDNVVYTEDFVKNFGSDDFQKKFLRALTPYMLKTWKVDEDHSIELIGISQALVKTLAEKKLAIHPDFVQQSLEKMRETEAEGMGRIRKLLGSQVRVESYKKFEKQFFEKYEPLASPEPANLRAPSAATPDVK